MSDEITLPISDIRTSLNTAIAAGPVILTAPTGSGKSTEIPRWCSSFGKVLVVEPRRVACRGLAVRVAFLEGTELGTEVGYAVRDDYRFKENTKIVYATPGVVLRMIATKKIDEYATIVLDEFHERSLDVDLILALLKERYRGNLIVTSATIDAKRLADFVRGKHMHAPGRVYPVDIHYIEGEDVLPDVRGLEGRIHKAIGAAAKGRGDILIFLPGKAEITRIALSLSGQGLSGQEESKNGFAVLQIHGGLSLADQSKVFSTSKNRRIILATNVAETSITIPGIGVVIDSGLVRRTRYINGRGFLTLASIALDSADQRAGRAGRTGPGVCYRLWSQKGLLEKQTPPEIYREALAPLLLGAASCGASVGALPFIDVPKEYAVDSAREDLKALGAIDDNEKITKRGKQIFNMPLDAPLGNLLVESERLGCLEDAIDLVSVLCVGRTLFVSSKRPLDPEDDLRIGGSDVDAIINAVRFGKPKVHELNPFVLSEARSIRRRLRKGFDINSSGNKENQKNTIDKKKLLIASMRSDKRCVFIARNRKGRTFFSNGGTEIVLSKDSAVEDTAVKAIVVFSSMAIGQGYKDAKIFATSAAPVPLGLLVKEEFGQDRICSVAKDNKGVVFAKLERVFAGCVLETREEVPVGVHAQEAVAQLFLRGSIFRGSLETTKKRLAAAALLKRIIKGGMGTEELDEGDYSNVPVPSLEQWVSTKLETLGLERGDELGLLSAEDFLAPDVPEWTMQWLDRNFVRTLALGDVTYTVEYDFQKREVVLIKVSGNRKNPPSVDTVPAFRGFRIKVRHHSKVWVLRDR